MVGSIVAIVVFLGLLSAMPYLWPDGFSQPPVIMIGLLAAAAVIVLVAGFRRRSKGWETDASD
ncbi:hypothetical protein [Muricoccus aerilatus]|uniref:hypothetical protein n=1 Tax=Muricoccus aerilatus TaxID=452982 RepID=UPI0005C2340C|nr:hypothetical protein [Roseomonas aerilata]